MRLGSLFAGIGGFELAATWAGIEPVWSNEIDPFACKVLNKNFNHEIIQKDIKNIGVHNLPAVDIISGGFPCQPFSQAGKRKGIDDDRYLWPEMLRVISELRPSYVIGENVAGLLSMENGETLKGILADLEAEGYYNEVFNIPACGVGAWHKRERIWICAHSVYSSNRTNSGPIEEKRGIQEERRKEGRTRMSSGTSIEISKNVSNSKGRKDNGGKPGNVVEEKQRGQGSNASAQSSGENVSESKNLGYVQRAHETKREGNTARHSQRQSEGSSSAAGEYWETEPDVGRVADGIPNRVDRLKGLGNAIVPHVAYEIFKAIKELDGQ